MSSLQFDRSTAGQSFFTGLWACDRSGRGPASVEGRLAGLTLPYSNVNYGHLLGRPSLGPCSLRGCCHRDSGGPLVFWGADRDPVILVRGDQT